MDLVTIMSDLCDKKYRFHLAKTTPKGNRPIDALARSEDTWLSWQLYRGNAKERFTVDRIVSFAQIAGNKFLFGGIFHITSRASDKYEVVYSSQYKELIGRLVIEYLGNNSRATVFKPTYIYENSEIIALYEHKFKGEPFSSFEEINHNFNAIELVINNGLPDWKVALSAVSGIYLISDEEAGKHYVGSAYGGNGIWGRWCNYINSYHGNNDDLVELFEDRSESYFRENFRFSILEVISSSVPKEDVIKKESLWKEKLFSRKHGYNRN